ncbi:MAG: hypothetical protein ACKVGZ_12300 [Alphaproteobacteria bacterium]
MQTAATLVEAAQWWGIIGALVAAVFLAIGIDRVDENARGSFVFWVLLIPGAILLWPLVLWRWEVLEAGRDSWVRRHAPPRRAHAKVWKVLAVVIPLLLVAGLTLNQQWPADFTPQKIAEPGQ